MKPLVGSWTGIVGGTNIGKVGAFLQQENGRVTGQFTFQDLAAVPVRANLTGLIIDGRWIDASLLNITPTVQPSLIPPGVVMPNTGRVLGVIEEDGTKITGYWLTNIGTGGGFILLRST